MAVVSFDDYCEMDMGPLDGVACTWFYGKHKQSSAVFDSEALQPY